MDYFLSVGGIFAHRRIIGPTHKVDIGEIKLHLWPNQAFLPREYITRINKLSLIGW